MGQALNKSRDGSAGKTVRDAARMGALRLLAAVDEGATLDEAATLNERLSPPDRARARRLALEVLRCTQPADSFCCLLPDLLPVLRDIIAVPVTRPALSVSGMYSSIFHS